MAGMLEKGETEIAQLGSKNKAAQDKNKISIEKKQKEMKLGAIYPMH